jgi:hypothetical protein
MTLDQLRRHAVSRSLFAPRDLAGAIDVLGYVQADPIRAPARAQDLILRHRVHDYRIDDLEKQYPQLPVFEDMLHNYGFFPRSHLSLLYPRKLSPRWDVFLDKHVALRRRVLRYLREHEEAHPRDVEKAIGSGARINGWGGTSSATTLMLEAVHREGRARVVRRESGLRIYSRAPALAGRLSSPARADGLIRLVVNLYAPLPLRSLNQLISMMGYTKPEADYAKRIDLMVKRGELARHRADHLEYVWPANETAPEAVDDEVRFLAPFDPVVWDRRRFEHFWGWAYRFEAYTPPAKRKMGYYALPLLWREHVIGWANATAENGKLKVDFGYVTKRPREVAFRLALEREVERLRRFLAPA